MHLGAVAVELDFVRPFRAGWCCARKRAELRFDKVGCALRNDRLLRGLVQIVGNLPDRVFHISATPNIAH